MATTLTATQVARHSGSTLHPRPATHLYPLLSYTCQLQCDDHAAQKKLLVEMAWDCSEETELL
jgi:hypothetical protein